MAGGGMPGGMPMGMGGDPMGGMMGGPMGQQMGSNPANPMMGGAMGGPPMMHEDPTMAAMGGGALPMGGMDPTMMGGMMPGGVPSMGINPQGGMMAGGQPQPMMPSPMGGMMPGVMGAQQAAPQQMAAAANFTGRINLSAQELPYYTNLFGMIEADSNTPGFVTGDIAAPFLAKSGLKREVLHEIWRIADFRQEGRLHLEDFCVACRLVALAQAGVPPSDQAIAIEPPALPTFDFARRRQTSESNGVDAAPVSAQPLSSRREAHAWVPDSYTPPMMSPQQTPPNVATPKNEAAAWVDAPREPSPRPTSYALPIEDKIKYEATFRRTDRNGDGIVEAEEGRQLLKRSRLSDSELALIWALVDRDSDGRLCKGEFVVAMHLVTLRKKGLQIPSHLPPELEAVCSESEVPEGVSPPRDGPPPRIVDASGGLADGRGDRGRGVGVGREREPVRATAADFFDDEGDRRVSPQRRAIYASEPARRPLPGVSPMEWREGGMALLEGVVEGDRHLSQSLKGDVDALAEETRRVGEVNEALRAELLRERSEVERQLERKRDFEREIEDLRMGLEELKEERRSVELQRVSLSRDLSHYQEEIAFLRQQAEELRTDIRATEEANQSLERNYRQTDTQLRQLDSSRKNVVASAAEERDLLKREEREIAQMKSTLERMRREKADLVSRQNVLQEKMRQADQDRTMMLSSLEAERTRLGGLQKRKQDLQEEKLALHAEMTSRSQQTWMQNRNLSQYATQPLDRSTREALLSGREFESEGLPLENRDRGPHSWATPVMSGAAAPSRGRLVKDSKGVPASAAIGGEGAVASPYASVAGGGEVGAPYTSFASSPNKGGWTTFATADPEKDTPAFGAFGH
uniref:Calmodulin n=1 Tax=Chromera velia CCMP2878 TaxID=1169474 RepID=A0A0G4IDN4_9ALVE|eukprot:Cvel_13492.t1-p1 / transcript=Cvel_13492.t1 / gene=Cvel_13492 / organism=Chromera_velia_CCMP2878 / gene_product=Intersectin-1, putative / transcript_product=Intersectin-1, putative / location=Cvel_scaffold923:22435-30879(-) / protein_length=861 / sequence_SO=supercontig / SO=protein_coding / is_pseudo=false